MLHYTDYIKEMMKKYEYPKEAVRAFTNVELRLDSEPDFSKKFDRIQKEYMLDKTLPVMDMLKRINELADEVNIHRYTLAFVFVMNCTEILKEDYKKAGLPEKLFWDSVDDLRSKLLACIHVKHVPGTFVAEWNDGLLKMTRFSYGRFQYEEWDFPHDDFTMKSGKVIHKGDKVINFHIPEYCSPITRQTRLESYKEAYKHYNHLFPDGKVVFCCWSWLLYTKQREFLPKGSNILDFLDDFEIVEECEKIPFENAWRIFDDAAELPPEKLPRDSSLRRAYADWLASGHTGGEGLGVFEFDGEKILK